MLLSGYAFEIFHGISLLTHDVSERTKSLQRRTESVIKRLPEIEAGEGGSLGVGEGGFISVVITEKAGRRVGGDGAIGK